MQVAVTTSKDETELIRQAQEIGSRLNLLYIERQKQSLEKLRSKHCLEFLLVVEKDRLVIRSPQGEYFWHPNMAVPRLKALRKGQNDPMVEAMALELGHQVLDCTLGMGSDALVAAYAVGAEGRVTGLEASPLIAFMTRWGLEHFQGQNTHVQGLLSRISVIKSNYCDYLGSMPDNSFDVVYFDPMFRRSREKSCGINPIRPLADPRPVSAESIREALRVSRNRVVLKEGSDSQEFSRLQADSISGGKYSPVAYGVWIKQGKDAYG